MVDSTADKMGNRASNAPGNDDYLSTALQKAVYVQGYTKVCRTKT